MQREEEEKIFRSRENQHTTTTTNQTDRVYVHGRRRRNFIKTLEEYNEKHSLLAKKIISPLMVA